LEAVILFKIYIKGKDDYMKTELLIAGSFFCFAEGTKKLRRIRPFKRKEAKIGRNDPCPCKSGLKYKLCCGARKTVEMPQDLFDQMINVAYD
jgi:SEC-C motif